MKMLGIGLFGFLGATARYSVGLLMGPLSTFPIATLSINVMGCFCIGFLVTFFSPNPRWAPFIPYLTTGFLGAFTTFSAFSWETWQFFQKGDFIFGGLNVFLNLLLCLLATGLGLWLAKCFI